LDGKAKRFGGLRRKSDFLERVGVCHPNQSSFRQGAEQQVKLPDIETACLEDLRWGSGSFGLRVERAVVSFVHDYVKEFSSRDGNRLQAVANE